MYVPGMDQRKLNKVSSLNVDTAVLDIEDGVAVNQKAKAREMVPEALKSVDFGTRTEKVVRVNGVDSGMMAEDIAAVVKPSSAPDGLLLPKVEGVEHLKELDKVLKNCTSDLPPIPLFILVESPHTLLNLQAICEWSTKEHSNLRFDLQVLIFGSDDYMANMGGRRTLEAKEVLYARQHLVTVAKAYGIQAIDMVHIDYKDLSSLAEHSRFGAEMGYSGKQVIHPSQVAIVQDSFSPTSEQVEWAKSLCEEFEKHQDSGKGAFTFRGQMIDRPLLLQAQNILKLHQMTS
jgi:citrate lyase subunit beta-like protein